MEMEKMMKMMQGMCQMDGMNTPEFMKDMRMSDNKKMNEICKMMDCKMMDQMNRPRSQMSKDMPMPDPEKMKHMCKMMGKGDFASSELCQDFMEIFKEK